ncbi:HlyD family efflux transporter periplasmic adaptor subunit [Niveibacterium umoris]|uniref:HlyD family secretion protein n=1 Tax=Niveibacterium umoris TaxID=1193620 RepID=A0A840BM39_9RHOO|nr:HlyD family efflux transporter periplasmic adaptor subunit [Niveibacterium umoris]MBB4013554.1 HlyD family secretion protein [Niveibacterium umoris]
MNARPLILALFAAASLAACSAPPEAPMLGYVELEPTRVAAPYAGRLVKLAVTRGGSVAGGGALFALDADVEQPALLEARARREQSAAQAADLATGKRPAELDSLRARVAAAESALRLAEQDLRRQQDLATQGFLSPATLDGLRERVRSNAAQLAQASADLHAAELAGREAQRAAAASAIKVAEAQQAQAAVRLALKTVNAPAAARVEDTYYREGEWVPAGTPVVSLLPAGSTKLRFYIPQARLPEFPAGSRVEVLCDGCRAPVAARITWVASSAEFTPPVIYSKDNRAKLVYMAEARPEGEAHLAPGQPVEVRAGAPK